MTPLSEDELFRSLGSEPATNAYHAPMLLCASLGFIYYLPRQGGG